MKKFISIIIIFFLTIVNYQCTTDDTPINSPNNSPTSPTSPRNLTALFDSTQGKPLTRLNWETPTNNGGAEVLQYIIYKGTSPNNMEILKYVNADSLTCEDNNITNIHLYYYAVSSKNEIGESTQSNVVNVFINQTYFRPSQPENFSLQPGDNKVKLLWTTPISNGGSAIINYKLYKATSPNNFLLYKTLSPTLTSYIDSSVINLNTYEYRITASNFLYESEPTITISATPNSDAGTIKGMVTFVDTNFVLSGGIYLISAYPSTGWPPMGGPTSYDTISITRTNKILDLIYNYKIQNVNTGDYVVSIGFRKNSGGQSPLMSVYGCDTLRTIYPGGIECFLNPTLKATIGPLNEGATGIDMISWSDTAKKIY